jgi:hypothetical protein
MRDAVSGVTAASLAAPSCITEPLAAAMAELTLATPFLNVLLTAAAADDIAACAACAAACAAAAACCWADAAPVAPAAVGVVVSEGVEGSGGGLGGATGCVWGTLR